MKRLHCLVLSAALLLAPLSGAFSQNSVPSIKKIALIVPSEEPEGVNEKNDLAAFRFALSVPGIPVTEITTEGLSGASLKSFDIIIVPCPAAQSLVPEEVAVLTDAVNAGAGIILDAATPLSAALGLETSANPSVIEKVRNHQFPGTPLYWQGAEACTVTRPAAQDCRVLYADEKTGGPLAVAGRSGQGKYVFYSSLFDPASSRGYSRYPFLIETLESEFGYALPAERKTAAMYFDPGSRHFDDFERLVAFWRKSGVHRVYAGAWYDEGCDYGKLIRLCHENGILVYCWLELPMVSRTFWNKHPEWREKTALLREAHVDWRYLMNLADHDCRRAVMKKTATLLKQYDWDGVNVAEMYFESADGPKRPEVITPMNDLVRSDFKKRAGFDPADIFKPASPHYWKTNPGDWKRFAEYRRRLCNELKTRFLDVLAAVRKKKKDFEIIVTAIDASMAPELEDNISEDTNYLLSLRKKYGITLQVEDEWLFWGGKPERYAELGKYYRKAIADPARLEIDFNVVNNHEEGAGGLPAVKPTGEEMRQVVYNIDLHGVRPAFYAEDTIYPRDFRNIAAVLARRAEIIPDGERQWKVRTPFMITLHTGVKDNPVLMDNAPWLAGGGDEVIVPAGTHTVLLSENDYEGPRLTYISSELTGAEFTADSLTFSYTEDIASGYAVISRKPLHISIDDKPARCTVYPSAAGYSVKLPGGKHTVKITTR